MQMASLTQKKIQNYRAHTFRTTPGSRLITRDKAIEYVKERGFVFFWPIKNFTLPSLWVAVASDRPVADAHDDPGHITWGWKDSLLGSRSWYYAKILRKRATMIAMQVAPYFYALSENYGAPDEDYLTQYEQGRMTQEAKTVYETLVDKGPLDTIALRREARLSSRESESRFSRALAFLQADFKVLPVGVTQAGAWRYAHAYDILPRHYPEIPEQARSIGERQARTKLINLYLRSVGAANISDIPRLFGWRPAETLPAIDLLVQDGVLTRKLQVKNDPGEWVALTELL